MLQKNGYKVLSAANGQEGLQLLASEPVDAIVLEYNLARRGRSEIASEIKQLRSNIPMVMLAENAELADAALESVDALVSTSDLLTSSGRPSTSPSL
jgi:CheY-like chemotaxis protein